MKEINQLLITAEIMSFVNSRTTHRTTKGERNMRTADFLLNNGCMDKMMAGMACMCDDMSMSYMCMPSMWCMRMEKWKGR